MGPLQPGPVCSRARARPDLGKTRPPALSGCEAASHPRLSWQRPGRRIRCLQKLSPKRWEPWQRPGAWPLSALRGPGSTSVHHEKATRGRSSSGKWGPRRRTDAADLIAGWPCWREGVAYAQSPGPRPDSALLNCHLPKQVFGSPCVPRSPRAGLPSSGGPSPGRSPLRAPVSPRKSRR